MGHIVKSEVETTIQSGQQDSNERACEMSLDVPEPVESQSSDPNILRAALTREAGARRRAECFGRMQAEVVQWALDLVVREPDLEGFFGALTKNMVEEGESHTCAVWLIDEQGQRCELWMVYVQNALYMPQTARWDQAAVVSQNE